MEGLDTGRINIASLSLGAASACFIQSRNYTKVRSQFGKKISEFQSVEFKLADMFTELTAARMMVRRAAKAIDLAAADRSVLAAAAKRYATDACATIADEAIQIHGGYGYLSKYDV